MKPNGERLYEFELPLLQSGVISGISSNLGNIITNAPVFYGNSGGAVLYEYYHIERSPDNSAINFTTEYQLIGVATCFIPFILDTKMLGDRIDISNSGYSVVVPIDYAFELMEE